jgi:hypothetical protein
MMYFQNGSAMDLWNAIETKTQTGVYGENKFLISFT